MLTTMCAANAEEVHDLITWLDDHPDGVNTMSRDAVAQWLMDFLQNTEVFPSLTAVPEWAVDVLDAVIEDWIEVLTAHDERFLTELEKTSQ